MNDLVPTGESAIEIADANLRRYADKARGAFAPNTERAIKADTGLFADWCREHGLCSFPADVDTVTAFVDAMAEVKAPATVRRYVASIAHQHRAGKVDPNPARDGEVGLALKRMHREQGRAQTQAAPLNRKLVEKMLEAPGVTLRHLRNRAILAMSYDTLARRSELVALTVADLTGADDGSATVAINRSKTDQEGTGSTRYVAPDSMQHVLAWIEAAGITHGHLFRAVNKGGAVGGPLTPGEVARAFKSMAEAAGVPVKGVAAISGHSCRVGAAQDMVRHGIEMPHVMQAGGWRTMEMVSRYAKHLEAWKGGSAKLAVLQNRG